MVQRPRPMALLIMDGWGFREETEHNAIAVAHTPNWDRLWKSQVTSVIETSGINVGLPKGQMGNSEVGHLNLGSGRVVYQDYTRITAAIENGQFQQNEVLQTTFAMVCDSQSTLHVMGLLSPGGVHSHEDHFVAAVEMAVASGVKDICVHAMLDGRDMPPRSAGPSLDKLNAQLERIGCGRIATICGRYYAMDRDKRWDRIEQAFNLYTLAQSRFAFETTTEALEAAYQRDENDEFVQATRVGEAAPIADGDAVLFMNFRADRARQITQAFTASEFDGFKRAKVPELAAYTCLTEYHQDFDAPIAFPPEKLPNVLGEYLSALGLRQLRIAETEKYAHVTFFFNGGVETPFEGEDRILIPSPQVATYDLQPQMSALEVAEELVNAVLADTYDVIICNFANADMVGHTGKFAAAVEAIEALDVCIGKIAEALKTAGGEMLITADHGNAEKMLDEHTGQAHTAHTTFKVPLLYMGRAAQFADGGTLSDIAPTLLHLMGLEPPPEMTGKSLITFE